MPFVQGVFCATINKILSLCYLCSNFRVSSFWLLPVCPWADTDVCGIRVVREEGFQPLWERDPLVHGDWDNHPGRVPVGVPATPAPDLQHAGRGVLRPGVALRRREHRRKQGDYQSQYHHILHRVDFWIEILGHTLSIPLYSEPRILTLVYRSWQKIPSWTCFGCHKVASNRLVQSWQMIPWLTEGVIVLHHNGVSLLSMAPYSCGVAREKGLFCSRFDECINTLCLFPENCPSFEYFLQAKNLLILSYLIYFDQGKRSCPETSCVIWNA